MNRAKFIFTSIILSTFLYSQSLWAFGLPVDFQANPAKSQNFLPPDLQENFSKDSCRIEVKPTDFSDLEAFLALLDPYKSLQNHTQSVLNNEIGDISYEKVFAEAESFFTESKSVNEYWYGYDQYGQIEKTKENEIYSDTSRTFWGKLFDVLIYGPLALLPDDIFFGYIKPAFDAVIGFLNPLYIPVIIGLDFIRNIASGMNPGDAIRGAVIQLATWAISYGVSGGFGPNYKPPIEQLVGQELVKAALTKAVQTVASRVAFDLLKDDLGTFGAALVSALVSNLVTTVSPITGFDTGLLTDTGAFDWLGIVQTVAQAGIKAGIEEIAKNNPDLAWALPLVETLLNTAISQAIQKAREAIKEQKIKEMQTKGYNVTVDQNKNIIGLTKIDQENGIIYYFTPDEKLQYSDQTVQEDGEEYIIRTYGLDYSEIYIRDEQTGSYNLLFKGEGWFNSIEKYQNKEGTALQFISLTSPDGKTTYFELDGRPILATYPDGKILSYNYNGNPEGWVAKDALPYWTDKGEFRGSYIEKDIGTTYFDRNGNKEAFILKDYTPQEQNGRIIGQYKDIDKDTYIYRDTNGEFKNIIRITDDGVYQNDGWWTTFFNNANVAEWTRENCDNSPKYYYDANGINLLKVLTTNLNESGLVKGFTITDLKTGNFRQYNEKGELQAYYLARKDADGNVYGYKGEDTKGTQIIIDRDGNIHSTLTKEGIYTAYRRDDPSQIYYVLRPDAVYMVKTGEEIRFILGYNPDEDKYILYDKLGTKVTDNPVIITAKLNLTLLTLPAEIRDKIWADTKNLLQAVTDSVFRKPQYTTDGVPLIRIGALTNFSDILAILKHSEYGKMIYLNIPEGFNYEMLIESTLNPLLKERGLIVGKTQLIGNTVVQIEISGSLIPLTQNLVTTYINRNTVYADTKYNTADLSITAKGQRQLTEISQMLIKDKDAYKGHLENTIVKNAYKNELQYKEKYQNLLKIFEDTGIYFKLYEKVYENLIKTYGKENSHLDLGGMAKERVDNYLREIKLQKGDPSDVVMLSWDILNIISDNPILRDKYRAGLLEMYKGEFLGAFKDLDPKKPIWFIASGWNTSFTEAISLGGLNSRVTERLKEKGINDNKIWFISNLESSFPLDFRNPERRADEAAFALAGSIIQAHEMYPDQPIFLQVHSLAARELGEALIILEMLGYTKDNNNMIVTAIFPFEPAVNNEAFSEGGIYNSAIQNTVQSTGIVSYTKKDLAGVAYSIHTFIIPDGNLSRGFLKAGPEGQITEKLIPDNVSRLIEAPLFFTTGHSNLYSDSLNFVGPYWDFVLYQYNKAVNEFNRSRNK